MGCRTCCGLGPTSLLDSYNEQHSVGPLYTCIRQVMMSSCSPPLGTPLQDGFVPILRSAASRWDRDEGKHAAVCATGNACAKPLGTTTENANPPQNLALSTLLYPRSPHNMTAQFQTYVRAGRCGPPRGRYAWTGAQAKRRSLKKTTLPTATTRTVRSPIPGRRFRA